MIDLRVLYFALLLLPAALPADSRDSRPASSDSASTATPERDREAALEKLKRWRVRVEDASLREAAMYGRAETLAALLDAGLDPNCADVVGPPLSSAVMCEPFPVETAARLATVEALLSRGANADHRDQGGNSILMSAVTCPPEVVARLIEAGAKVNGTNEQGFSPLHNAMMRGKWAVAELLVAKGARVSKESLEEIFFELPTDREKLAIIERAIAKE